MPVKQFQPVCLVPRKKRHRGRPAKLSAKKRHTPTQYSAQVSQDTRSRLLRQAMASPAYDGMEPDAVAAYVNQKVDQLLVSYPWWFGALKRDQPKRVLSDAQRQVVERMRQRKIEIQREINAPYVPEGKEDSTNA